MAQGFDTATKLNKTTAQNLKNAGFEYAIRYLPTTEWKSITKSEVDAILNAGLKLVSIYQCSNNKVSYFSYTRGKQDGQNAQKLAKELGQPKGTAIYFAVDFDVQPKDLQQILDYIKGLKETVKDYKIGIYGSYYVVNEVKKKAPVDYYWQTYAWSNGKVAEHIHMHQYQNGVKVAGILIDRNNIKKAPGAWNEESKKKIIKANLKIDGYWGKETTKALQRTLGTPVDGIISGQYKNHITNKLYAVSFGPPFTGSLVIKALQKLIGAKVDGFIGPETIRKLQAYLGTIVDGRISKPSMMVKEMQRRLNNGTFIK